MKTRIVTVILAICALAFSSCTKNTIIEGPQMQTVLINVEKNMWKYSNIDNNNYFMATVKMPEITKDVYQTGLVKMYRVYDFNSSNGSQMEMPYVRLNEQYIPAANQWVFYTETVDYEYGVGQITIFYTASDFDYEIDETFVPDAMQFRCVVME